MENTTNQKQYIVLMGNFGSGKTELALHFALSAAAEGKPTTLIDLDIINPYFRAAERKAELQSQGVRLITPNYALSNVEIITVPPEVYSAFSPGVGAVIFDCGGDGTGARALGQYHSYFEQISVENLRVWLVINPHRPLSATAEKVIAMMTETEHNSRLKITGLINNSNISYETKPEDLLHGYHIIKQVAQQTQLPVVITSGEQQVLDGFLALAKQQQLEQKYLGEPLYLKTRMHRDWQRFTKFGI